MLLFEVMYHSVDALASTARDRRVANEINEQRRVRPSTRSDALSRGSETELWESPAGWKGTDAFWERAKRVFTSR